MSYQGQTLRITNSKPRSSKPWSSNNLSYLAPLQRNNLRAVSKKENFLKILMTLSSTKAVIKRAKQESKAQVELKVLTKISLPLLQANNSTKANPLKNNNQMWTSCSKTLWMRLQHHLWRSKWLVLTIIYSLKPMEFLITSHQGGKVQDLHWIQGCRALALENRFQLLIKGEKTPRHQSKAHNKTKSL